MYNLKRALVDIIIFCNVATLLQCNGLRVLFMAWAAQHALCEVDRNRWDFCCFLNSAVPRFIVLSVLYLVAAVGRFHQVY